MSVSGGEQLCCVSLVGFLFSFPLLFVIVVIIFTLFQLLNCFIPRVLPFSDSPPHPTWGTGAQGASESLRGTQLLAGVKPQQSAYPHHPSLKTWDKGCLVLN